MTIDPVPHGQPVPDELRAWMPDPVAIDPVATDPVIMDPVIRDPQLLEAYAVLPGRRRPALAVVSVLLVLALALAGYLFTTTRGYQDLAASTEKQARVIGTELASTRTELEGATAELEGVRTQLATAQARITALADEKAQLGDDREIQRQLTDYQQRVSVAAGTVASALDRCIQGQDQLITYLKDAAAYAPADLQKYESEVKGLCQSATQANQSLQDELAR